MAESVEPMENASAGLGSPTRQAADDAGRALAAESWSLLTGLLIAGQGGDTAVPPPDVEALPLTILAGFLGAGKTTLVNHVLAHPEGRRLLVLVNDFGSINIDERLISGRTADTISLSNGCACCSLAGDLSRRLRDIVASANRPDAILLEASGISDPLGLTYVAACIPGIRIDGVVTVLDAESMQAHAEDEATARLFANQLSAADFLLVNKQDLVDDAHREEGLRWLASRADGRPVLPTTQAKIDVDVLLGLARKQPHAAPQPRPSRHTREYESASFSSAERLDGPRVRDVLDALPAAVLRAKGSLSFAQEPHRRIVYQRVGRRWSFERTEAASDGATSSLVVIARRGELDFAQLRSRLGACGLSPHAVREPA